MKCPDCGEETCFSTEGETMVGYGPCPINDRNYHNDNCLKRYYTCANGHRWIESLRRTCKTEGCDWKGKEKCFCHEGSKVDTWTDGKP